MQHAVLHGDDITGATTFRIVKELDAGPVFGVVTEPIRPDDTAGDLLDRIAVSGAGLLVATLDGIESGELRAAASASGRGQPRTQDRRRRRAGGLGACPAVAIGRLVRACTPAPGAWTELDGARLKLGPVTELGRPRSRHRSPARPGSGPGELRVDRAGVLAGTGTGPVRLGEVQPAGKRRMTAGEWARGLHLVAAEPVRLGQACPAVDRAEMAGRTARRAGNAARPGRGARPAPIRSGGPCATCCSPWPSRGAYANLLLPAVLRDRQLTAGTPRWPPSCATARCAARAATTRYSTRAATAPGRMDPPVREVLRLGVHQLLGHPDRRACRGGDLGGPGQGRGRAAPGRLRQRGAAPGRPPGTSRPG